MKCAACGHDGPGRVWRGVKDYEYGTYRPVDYLACSGCGTIAQSPLPDASLIPSFYPPDYRNHLAGGDGGFFPALKRIQTKWLARRVARHIGGIDRKVLELGCGSGGLLPALQDLGFRDLAGADFYDAGGAMLASRGIRFRQGDIDREFPFEEQFDAVIMVNVIEHFLDPVGVLRRIHKHLVPGGRIILITPNAGALELPIFGRFWSGFHAPRHIHLFTSSALERLGRSLGFAQVAVQPSADPGQWAISVQNALQSSRLGRARLWHGLAWYTIFLSAVSAPIAWLQNFWPRRSTTIATVFTAAGQP